MKKLIKNGLVVLADCVEKAQLLLESGKIQAIYKWTYVNTLDKKSRKIMLLFLVPHPPFAVVSNNQ